MSFRLIAKRRVTKKIRKFTPSIKRKIENVFILLKDNPLPYNRLDLAKMKGFEDVYRIRIGNVRIIYKLNLEKRVIEILDMDYRESVYK